MIKLTQDVDLENYRLILPSVSVGNVGQLSVDLLIFNLNLKKIGQIFSTAFVPVVGANAYREHSNELVTAIDIYAGIEERLVVIQIRSPYVNELTSFFDELARFVIERKIAEVIILASSYDHEKRDIQDLKLRYVASPKILSESSKQFHDFHWIRHSSVLVPDSVIPGGGFARGLFDFLSNANISCVILFKFCSEGDNIPDAITLVRGLHQWKRILGTSSNNDLKYPPSWKHLFGRPVSHDMY